MYQMFLENKTDEAFIEELHCHSAHCVLNDRKSLLSSFVCSAVHRFHSVLSKSLSSMQVKPGHVAQHFTSITQNHV
ncbi:hypothetical protein A9264_11705 [Vibrio sp. UCD-FRSSP16_10]|uniref:hypothetical protein n=1 Tax=unclassified Vibrio TaxID=2614977 RepID=UPI0007FD425C|nr:MULTISPECIES: hypothetical protein [unclassified Vibrio]OBT16298.1 hypothetical protein A9260_11915 [Vibrio sp. UCD-FRSSP16_30]OBT21163.1 hypothetical protein A9264_11705 [Vibrio sp. UCD-FRSSP16_10]